MRQVVQNIRSGELRVAQVPEPLVRPGHVLIANTHSLISAGTEKIATDLAKKSLLAKARERPDQVRRVLEKLKNEGLFSTVQQVREKLDAPMTLGYASTGVVLAAGAGVQAFKPGDLVASNGPHAGVVCVPANLCAHVPAGVSPEHAAFTVLGAIALQGVRLAELGLGDVAFVVGLGLIGQITVALLKAQGCRVLGTDLDSAKCELARRMGADEADVALGATTVHALTRGLGADAVLITASTKSDGPVELAAEAVRQKGRVVAVGLVGLDLPRRPFYFKEAELVVSCSYGPGRYDARYEERGEDYPAAYVRWTEQRNLQAVLDTMSAGRLDVAPLITHRFPIDRAEAAYALLDQDKEPYLGILLEYPQEARRPAPALPMRAAPKRGRVGVGCLGAGNFARMVLLPAAQKEPALELASICSGAGVSASHVAGKLGFRTVAASEAEVLADPAVDVVFVLTRHDQHGTQVLEALRAGKHVFVEKPLALTVDEVLAIEAALGTAPGERRPVLLVGFNRRFSPAAATARGFFSGVREPLSVSIRMNVGDIPADHWTQDEATGGGRLIGEACHAIDLATFLVGAPPVRVFAESVGGPSAPKITDDRCFLTLRHENGAISSIGYLAGGDKGFPKERVEILGGGRIAVIDDFKSVTTSVGGKQETHRALQQDKGHRAEIAELARVLSHGGPAPIPWGDLRAVSLASILAVRSLREGVAFEVG